MFRKIIKIGRSMFYLVFGKVLVVHCGGLTSVQPDSLFVHPQPNLERVVREDYLIDACRGKRVLHFGFLDIPITVEKISSGTLLHTKISRVASSLYGVDIDEVGITDYRRLTGDSENSDSDLLLPESNLSFLSERFDIILFPEVLEHLVNAGTALKKLKEILLLNPGSTLLVTVPNAYSLPHFVFACNNIELVHADHYYCFSPVTLRKLIMDCGFSEIDIILYSHIKEEISSPGITEHGIVAICKA